MQVKIASMGGGGAGGAPRQKAAPRSKNQPLQVDTPERQGPFYETAGGIPVDKPFYRKKISVKDYIKMRRDEQKNDPTSYRLGEVLPMNASPES
jgi:hypothetical protein